jgi:hypothetical protein
MPLSVVAELIAGPSVSSRWLPQVFVRPSWILRRITLTCAQFSEPTGRVRKKTLIQPSHSLDGSEARENRLFLEISGCQT